MYAAAMRRLAWLSLIIALVLVLAGSAVAAASQVLFVGAIGPAQVRPSQLALSADGSLEVNGVTWHAWGGPRAIGTGTAEYHGCTPNCAAAPVHHVPVAITLSNVRTCKGKPYYTHVALLEPSGRLLDAGFLRISWNPCGTD
jgi:hypothetical protein